MKIAYVIIRVLLGALFAFSGIAYLFTLFPVPELEGNMKVFNDGLEASGYLLYLVKSLELICGISFIVNRFIPLATLAILPVSVNILLTHIFLAPEGLILAAFVFLATLFLIYVNRDKYKRILDPK